MIFSLPKMISSAARPPIATSICVMSSDLEMCDLSFSGMKAVCPPDIPFATIVTCNHQSCDNRLETIKIKMLITNYLMDRGCIRCEVGDEGVASLVVGGNAEVLLLSDSTLPILAENVLVVRILKV